MSPILFVLLLHDLPGIVQELHPKVRLILYADDIAVFSRVRSHLQAALRSIESYFRDLGLAINLQKSKAMKFRSGAASGK